MKTGYKVSAYALALAIVFGGAWAAGAAVGPFGEATPPGGADGMNGPGSSNAPVTMAPMTNMTKEGGNAGHGG